MGTPFRLIQVSPMRRFTHGPETAVGGAALFDQHARWLFW